MSWAIFPTASEAKPETLQPRRSSRFRRRFIKPLPAVALLFAIISTAPVLAYGDPGDDGASVAAVADPGGDGAFVTDLDGAGFTYTSVPRAIEVGHGMCSFADQGKQEDQIISILEEYNDHLTAERARQFLLMALGAYCPQNLGIDTGALPEETSPSSQMPYKQPALPLIIGIGR